MYDNVGFETVDAGRWTAREQALLRLRFGKRRRDWRKRSLRTLRAHVKARLMIEQRAMCAYCRGDIEDNEGHVEIDHIVPISIAPQFAYHRVNLALTCRRCNARKRDHNPSRYSANRLVAMARYSRRATAYVWVHPHIHRYSDHILRSDGCIYSAVGGSEGGLAVITVCRLSDVREVLARRRAAAVRRARSSMDAVLAAVGLSPDVDIATLAQELHATGTTDLSEADLNRLIAGLRSSTPSEVLQRMSAT